MTIEPLRMEYNCLVHKWGKWVPVRWIPVDDEFIGRTWITVETYEGRFEFGPLLPVVSEVLQ